MRRLVRKITAPHKSAGLWPLVDTLPVISKLEDAIISPSLDSNQTKLQIPTPSLSSLIHFLTFGSPKKKGWGQPFNDATRVFPFMRVNGSSIKLSHFIPLQQALTTTSTTQDITSFNIAPYMFIAEDAHGVFPSVNIFTEVTRKMCYEQQTKIPSSKYWQKNQGEGLMGMSNLQTLGPGEIWTRSFNYYNHPFYFWQKPKYQPDRLWYLPFTHERGSGIIDPLPLS